MTATEALRLDNSNPELERVGAFADVQKSMAAGLVVLKYEVDSDHSTAKVGFTATFPMEVVTVIAHTWVGEASNTFTVLKAGSDAVCTALVATSAGLVSYAVAGATSATEANRILAVGETIEIGAAGGSNGDDQRGVIYLIGKRL